MSNGHGSIIVFSVWDKFVYLFLTKLRALRVLPINFIILLICSVLSLCIANILNGSSGGLTIPQGVKIIQIEYSASSMQKSLITQSQTFQSILDHSQSLSITLD